MKKTPPHPYHMMAARATLLHVRSSDRGLNDHDAAGRLQAFGANTLPATASRSPLLLLLRQFANPLIAIVIAAAIISMIIGHIVDAVFIACVVIINAVVSFVQEYKAENALEQLRDRVTQMARVVRGGRKKEIPAADLVVGDIVDVMAGDGITADGRIIAAEDFAVHESTLTGEWHDVAKNAEILAEDVVLSDQTNMVFSGTSAVQGHARYVVTATGSDMEIGKIASTVQQTATAQTPLQKKFAQLSMIVGGAIFCSILVFAAFGVWRGQPIVDIFLASTALVVSAIPEGLLPAITIVLIFGMRRLAHHAALVRRLNASETMGALTVICTDKTGTLTTGDMAVQYVVTGANDVRQFRPSALRDGHAQQSVAQQRRVLEIAAVVNDAYVEYVEGAVTQRVVRGRPTDRALLQAALDAGIDPDAVQYAGKLVDQEFFSSANKYATRVYQMEDGRMHLLRLGAPEEVMEAVSFIEMQGRRIPLQSEEGEQLRHTVERLTGQGLRVVACAQRILTEETYTRLHPDDRFTAMSLVGYIAIKDPLRDDVEESLALAERAGIRMMLITGDHAETARSVMAELGHVISDSAVCVGADLAQMTDAQLQRLVRTTKIFARVLPEHKIRIVRALQKNGDVVAMVGDGINDAPAIKAADVGIAVGESADITKEVADIVLINSSFTTIVTAIEQGRVIYENIRRVVIYLVADDFSEIFIFFCAMALGWPLPLLAIQVLWINVIEDSLPNIALTTEYDAARLMEEPPRHPQEPLLTRAYKKFIGVVFIVSGVSAAAFFWSVLHFSHDVTLARTAAFTLIAFDSLIFVYIVRSFRRPLIRRDIFNNWMLNGSVAIALVLLIAGVYVPPFTTLLHTVPLSLSLWGAILAITCVEVLFFEVAKRQWLYHRHPAVTTPLYLQ